MLLKDETGSLRLAVTGYQFPHATDLTRRFSWHIVEGDVKTPDGAWRFRYPALTCEETPMVAMWLTTVADWMEGSSADFAPPVLSFTSPNLTLAAAESAETGGVVISVGLDHECRPPWERFDGSSGYVVHVEQDVRALRQAATAWVAETAPYPDGLEQLADGAEAD